MEARTTGGVPPSRIRDAMPPPYPGPWIVRESIVVYPSLGAPYETLAAGEAVPWARKLDGRGFLWGPGDPTSKSAVVYQRLAMTKPASGPVHTEQLTIRDGFTNRIPGAAGIGAYRQAHQHHWGENPMAEVVTLPWGANTRGIHPHPNQSMAARVWVGVRVMEPSTHSVLVKDGVTGEMLHLLKVGYMTASGVPRSDAESGIWACLGSNHGPVYLVRPVEAGTPDVPVFWLAPSREHLDPAPWDTRMPENPVSSCPGPAVVVPEDELPIEALAGPVNGPEVDRPPLPPEITRGTNASAMMSAMGSPFGGDPFAD